MKAEELHSSVEARLAVAGQRYSTGRRLLISLLASVERPMTIPELLEEHPEIAQSSAYRNLTVLERAGAVTRIVTFGEHARFEMAEALMGHHHHLICTACGRVEDFTVSETAERTVDRAVSTAVARTGFAASSHRLDLLGLCAMCQAA